MLGKLVVHTSNYSIGSLAVTLAGFISFPILTRVFTVNEYGVLNLISSTLLLLVAISKLGMQHATVRFYSEVRAGKREAGLDRYYSTILFGMSGVGLAVAGLWAVASQIVPLSWWNDERLPPLLLLTSCLIAVRVLDSGLVNQLRAQQRSGVFSLYMALKRYVGLAAVLGALFFVSKDLWGFYAATIVTELLAVTGLAVWLLRGVQCRPGLFSLQLYRPMLAFGIPMVGYELCSIVLALGDRYVLQTLLGAEAVGIYSAAYNLCEYVQALLIASMGQAIMPMYMRLWDEKGETETAAFIRRFMHYYVMLVLPIVAGLAAVGPELLSVLASAKYSEGAVIIPYVIAGMILDGAIVITGAGLYIQKRTKTIMLLVLGSAVLNLALNFVLVPSMGILGAAVATLVSYAGLAALTLLLGQRCLRLPFPGAAILKFGLLSAAMYVVVSHIALDSQVATLAAKVGVGAAVYLALVWFCDGETRETVHRGWARAQRVA